MATTRSQVGSVCDETLYVGLELSKKNWKLGLSGGFGTRPWVCTVPSGDFAAVDRACARARQRFGLGRGLLVAARVHPDEAVALAGRERRRAALADLAVAVQSGHQATEATPTTAS